jgi:hypothetical protein
MRHTARAMHSNDAWGAVAELGASQHGAFTRRQATLAGISPRDIRRAIELLLVEEVVAGVLRFTGSPVTWRQRMWTATRASGGGFVAARAAAAHLHRLDGFDREPRLEVYSVRGRRIRGLDVVQHWGPSLPPSDVVTIDGVPTTGLARTVTDLAASGDGDAVLRMVDELDRREISLVWLEQTARRLHRPGQVGTRLVREVVASRDGRTPDSWFERLVERCIAAPGLPPWERQYEVRDGRRFCATLDLACPELRLGVEAHSKRFHFGSIRETSDQARDDELAALGWDLRYVGWYAATREPDEVGRMITRIAHRRAADLGITLPWAA